MAILIGDELDNTILDESVDATSYIAGLAGVDKLRGGIGADTLNGGEGPDILDGGAGRDTASYRDSAGIRVSLDGSLTANGEAIGDLFTSIENLEGSLTGNDVLSGNAYSNFLFGFGGNDTLYGRNGSDTLYGADGADILVGGAGNDTLNGSDGNDILTGGSGIDAMTGGDGADIFKYTSRSEGKDRISGFGGNDSLRFDHLAFSGARPGHLQASAFWKNSTGLAHDASDRFVYNTATHTLNYDSNGNLGGGDHAIIATFANSETLAASDMLIV
jgi:Ca2+-binding RTX toxin-like protein